MPSLQWSWCTVLDAVISDSNCAAEAEQHSKYPCLASASRQLYARGTLLCMLALTRVLVQACKALSLCAMNGGFSRVGRSLWNLLGWRLADRSHDRLKTGGVAVRDDASILCR
jgi:hypothetical protein